MARARLDRTKKFGNIFGIDEHGAVFTQGNLKFDVNGLEVGPGITPEVADPARPGAAGPAPTEPVAETEPTAEELHANLKQLHPSQIKKLVEEAGLTPVGGPGSMAANIQLLLDNAAG